MLGLRGGRCRHGIADWAGDGVKVKAGSTNGSPRVHDGEQEVAAAGYEATTATTATG